VNLLTSYEDCFKRGLLQKVQPSKEKAIQSMQKAEQWLKETQKNITSQAYDSCIASSYLAIFHSARAVLFRDGVREKSHYCIARYLERYVEDESLEEEWVTLLDRMREIRHMDQYTLQYSATHEEATSSMNSAKKFVNRMKILLD
jgi:uncharacterized protein (UPF0332 family)